ncbi:ATP-binding protein [Haloarcula sp. S1CR25-12]|uniref:histidine kinase n=1 Tax=Haloarcula saliterrae TaxID=2950534 RepID=A0ABU2F824_9EURY|nr:ATP-binding protein [Haloarcula sp. S1CR25-12]MDS0258422.1 ATP-binding protein [Haloarcula sp. S1CR25-12]
MSGWDPDRHVIVTGVDAADMGSLAATLEAATGLEAVAVAAGELLGDGVADADALVVVDSPPEHDGIETFRRVRADGWTLPVLLVSERVAPERVERALSAGVTEYLAAWTDDRAGELGARIRAHVRTPAMDGAVQAERWKTIVGALAHDAKNPLNVVTGRLELLDDDGPHSDAIQRSVERVESLLAELSTVATVAGPIEGVETVDLAEMVSQVWSELGGRATQLRVEVTETVEADPDCLHLVLERLFENALTHAGDDVTVTVGSTERGFYVADDGPGIPDGEYERVFEQGYGTARDGEGYGLFVAASVATAHGWDIVAGESDAGGARFDVRPT